MVHLSQEMKTTTFMFYKVGVKFICNEIDYENETITYYLDGFMIGLLLLTPF